MYNKLIHIQHLLKACEAGDLPRDTLDHLLDNAILLIEQIKQSLNTNEKDYQPRVDKSVYG